MRVKLSIELYDNEHNTKYKSMELFYCMRGNTSMIELQYPKTNDMTWYHGRETRRRMQRVGENCNARK